MEETKNEEFPSFSSPHPHSPNSHSPPTHSPPLSSPPPTAEDLVGKPQIDAIEKRKQTLKNFFTGWIKNNYDKAFLIILLVAFLIRLWIFTKTLDQPLWYDAASYLASARRWGLGLDIIDPWFYRRGPLWALISALVFGIGLGEHSIRFLVVLFSTGNIAVSYFLIKEMFSKKLALGVSICMTLSWVSLFFTARPLTSIPATFFLLLSFLFFWRGIIKKKGNKYIYLFAISLALALLTRMQYLMFTPVFLIAIFINDGFKAIKNKHLWGGLLIVILFFTPMLIAYNNVFGNPFIDITSHYLGISIESATHTTPRNFDRLFDYYYDIPYAMGGSQYRYLVFIPFLIGLFFFFGNLILGFDKIFKNKKIQKRFYILLWIVIPFFTLGYMIGVVAEQRYIMPIYPFLYLIMIYPIFKLENIITKNLNIPKKVLIAALFIIIFLLFIPNYNWAVSLIENKQTSYQGVKEAGIWIKQNSNPQDAVITASMPQIQYYSDRSAYSYFIGDHSINIKKSEGLEDFTTRTEEDFERFVDLKRPRFMILSVFESHEQWFLEYPQKHPELLVPRYGYPSNKQQPMIVVYEFDYGGYSSEDNSNLEKV